MIRSLKQLARHAISRAMNTPEARDAIRAQSGSARPDCINAIRNIDCGQSNSEADKVEQEQTATRLRDDMIFLSSRFRSGSTALWNAFRQLDYTTAYYEPFNERQFFNLQLRGSQVDPSHLGVDDYSREYNDTQGLDALYDEDWTRESLFMDENSWNPSMQRFIEVMAESSAKVPVMQFNRIDFRLPWIRNRFPNARIVHLWRNPREQWCSTLTDISRYPSSMPADQVPQNFYLDSWVRDLKSVFPFLESQAHPYRLFYLIWKCSYLFGQRYADHSVSFEALTGNPISELQQLVAKLDMPESQKSVETMRSVLVEPKPLKWSDYASAQWFDAHETFCEQLLDQFFGHHETHSAVVTKPC